MGGWLDRVAKRAASSTPQAVSPSPQEGSDQLQREAISASESTTHRSRRDFMKKAAIVGGAAWTVPLMQSALAPASAASGPKAGQACFGGDGSICSGDGSSCFGGICGAPGASCVGSKPCFGSSCSPGGICGGLGASCTTADATTGCATVGGNAVYCSAGSPKTCGGGGGNKVGALCGAPLANSPRCYNNSECKSFGGNPNRCV